MRIRLLAITICLGLLATSAYCQDEKQSKAEIKAQEKAEKQREKARIQAEKDEAKRIANLPAEIVVAAPADRVKAVLILAFSDHGYTISQETTYQMVFQRSSTGYLASVQAALIGGHNAGMPVAALTVLFVPDGSNVIIRVTGEIQVTTDQGVVKHQSLPPAKLRELIGPTLAAVKTKAESQ